MELQTFPYGSFIVSLTEEEWEELLAIKYVPARRRWLVEAHAEKRCWLPGTVGQLAIEYINRRWKEEKLPYQLRSEIPNEPWASPTKKLRMMPRETAPSHVSARYNVAR